LNIFLKINIPLITLYISYECTYVRTCMRAYVRVRVRVYVRVCVYSVPKFANQITTVRKFLKK